MERYDASEEEEEVTRVAQRAGERAPLIRGENGGKKGKSKYNSGLDTDFDDDNEQVVFSVGETKAGGNAAYNSHYSQLTPKSYQFKALFRKNLKLQVLAKSAQNLMEKLTMRNVWQIRQRCTLCCQIAVPLLLILYVGAMQILFNSLMDDEVRPIN
jgi:hypothetical protein